ncbi:MAG: hypothetical protein AAF390_07285 [Pseudomonadota bacterium]
MAYVELLRLDLRHAYLGDGPAALGLRALDPEAMARDDLLLRRDGPMGVVLGPEDGDRPAAVDLLILGDGPGMIAATRGADWDVLLMQTLDLGRDTWRFRNGTVTPIARPRGDGHALGAVSVALPAEGARHVRLAFESEAVVWTYHVRGGRAEADLEVVDPEEAVRFEDMGRRPLPDGSEARLLRARDGIVARARPPERFALRQPGPFGPKTLIPVLPTAAMDRLRPIPEADGSARLQADIHVTLTLQGDPPWP